MQALSTKTLAEFASAIDARDAPEAVRVALRHLLTDSLGVGIAGQQTPEHRRLMRAWPNTGGRSTLWGRPERRDSASATMLNAVSLCMLELDEGNKFARGHPGAHVLPAAVAEAERLGVGGRALLDALLAGYEVAARIARGFQPIDGLHPHGHWGAIGAAVAVGRLNELSPRLLAEAMDAAAGLALASPFSSALSGSFVRNTWVGTAGMNGVTAVRLAQADLGTLDETSASTFGRLLGSIDDSQILHDLGTRWEITGGYFKRHSSCNYTHSPADAALMAREHASFAAEEIVEITVRTHALALPLSEPAPTTRLAAMFSIPHVVAVALLRGECRPESFSEGALYDPAIVRLREQVRIELDADIDAARPASRGATLLITLNDGQQITTAVPNPIGDADHHPFTAADIDEKLSALIGAGPLTQVHRSVDALHADESVSAAFRLLHTTS